MAGFSRSGGISNHAANALARFSISLGAHGPLAIAKQAPYERSCSHLAHCSSATAERAEQRCPEGTVSLCDQGKLGGAWGWICSAPIPSGQDVSATQTGSSRAMNLTQGRPGCDRSRAASSSGGAPSRSLEPIPSHLAAAAASLGSRQRVIAGAFGALAGCASVNPVLPQDH